MTYSKATRGCSKRGGLKCKDEGVRAFKRSREDSRVTGVYVGLMNMKYHFYGNATDIYTKIQERTLVLIW
jgi:hypothetical protein